MAVIAMRRLGETVGAEVLDVDADRLLNDDGLPAACMRGLEEHGVLLFRGLRIDDHAQVAFCRKLGELARFPNYPIPEVMEISFDPDNPNAEYFASNDHWHIDGALDEVPAKASAMSAHVVADEGGETEFASTYAAYDALSGEERARYAELRVVHTFEAIQRRTYQDPAPEQLAEWASRAVREHPLVWEHRSGRRSLVFGATASHIVGMDVEEGRALLTDLERRATTPDRVFRHTWSVGDMVIWDNRGLVHRACPFDRRQPRRMHRTTLVGDEPIR
ncbi:Taurine dioxygenase, alpha-ketoglutarate-dependent [Thermomonospora echinospora]|uniref:Taurine dioxygenase, alpha-ketoglutarate-dependent n=1 Tax=Thermomonospora echinospora TaxID=1992 RepID=A0A1H6DEL8_9ACTN|nr:TauD/TfdA family dioxygenase [Thermomonospora echinospora]SEG83828.1 Taurine dioxygenase, alpha-ketoglutarate-dependent [Thermomonospora echinospora]